jgi:hypothetical protein
VDEDPVNAACPTAGDVPTGDAVGRGAEGGRRQRLLSGGASVVRTVGLGAVLFAPILAVCLLGRLTVIDGNRLNLVWPAARVAAVWFCAQRCAAACASAR